MSEAFKNFNALYKIFLAELKNIRVSKQADEDGNPLPLVDALTPKWCDTIKEGQEELEDVADSLALGLCKKLIPISEIEKVIEEFKKNAEKYDERWNKEACMYSQGVSDAFYMALEILEQLINKEQ